MKYTLYVFLIFLVVLCSIFGCCICCYDLYQAKLNSIEPEKQLSPVIESPV